MKRRTLYAFVALVLLPAGLCGQRYSFKHYDRETGLPNQSVTTLLQDRTGFLWVGTENGLFRYDGRRFRGFTTADGLPSSQVEALEQTRDGTLWVATLSGLARLTGDRFETVDFSPGRGTMALASDSLGRLYVGTSQGLLISRSPVAASQKPAFTMYTVSTQKSALVRSIAVPESGPVWYSCGQQLCRLDNGRVDSRAEWGVPNDLWEAVAIDTHGNVWARSRNKKRLCKR